MTERLCRGLQILLGWFNSSVALHNNIFKAAEQLGIPLETKRYKKWDLYAAVNMVYSDFYDEDKPDSMYIKDGYRFVSDPDFKRIGKMKIYAASAHKK